MIYNDSIETLKLKLYLAVPELQSFRASLVSVSRRVYESAK